MCKKLSFLVIIMLFLPACFKAPRDEYDPQNPSKVGYESRVVNAIGMPVSYAVLQLETDTFMFDKDGILIRDLVDPGIYKMQIYALTPGYDTIFNPACSLWAGRVVTDTFRFRRVVWDMENEPGVLPLNWAAVQGGWAIKPDIGNMENHVLAMRGHPFAYGAYGHAIYQTGFKDYVYSVEFKALPCNATGWQAGVIFGYQDLNNYYRFRVTESDIVFNRVVSGSSDTTFFNIPQGVPKNFWHNITIERGAQVIQIFLDGHQIGPGITDTRFLQGKVGVWVIGEAPSMDSVAFYYDNIMLEPRE